MSPMDDFQGIPLIKENYDLMLLSLCINILFLVIHMPDKGRSKIAETSKVALLIYTSSFTLYVMMGLWNLAYTDGSTVSLYNGLLFDVLSCLLNKETVDTLLLPIHVYICMVAIYYVILFCHIRHWGIVTQRKIKL